MLLRGIDKKRWVGSPRMSTFCQHLKGRKCQHRGVKKRQKLVNVACEWPLITMAFFDLVQIVFEQSHRSNARIILNALIFTNIY